MRTAIVGAGVVGRMIAVELLHQDVDVTVFEARSSTDSGGASHMAAGMLAPFAELDHTCPDSASGDDLMSMALRSLAAWPRLAQRLGCMDALRQSGTLLVAHHHDRPELERFWQRLTSLATKVNRGPGDGWDGWPFGRWVTPGEVEPALSEFRRGVLLPGDADVDVSRVLAAAASVIVAKGGTLNWNTPVVAAKPGRVELHARTKAFDWVFDCRGLGARRALPGLRGVRGEIFEVLAPDVALSRPVRLMHPRYQIYVVPRPGHRYLVGATEIESEDTRPVTVRSTLELLSAAYSLHAGFGEACVLAARTQCRPAMHDNLPVVTTEDGLSHVNGMFRHGYLLAPEVVNRAIAPLGLQPRSDQSRPGDRRCASF